MQLPECTQAAEPGHLYVVSTPIGNLSDISLRAASILNSCDLIACEDTRVTGNLLKHFGIEKSTISYRDANEKEQTANLIPKLQEGQSIALVSDAGTPTLSDPGFRIIRECRRLNIPVTPIPGPSACIAALSASGLPTNSFLFIGFLPPKTSARKLFFQNHENFEHTIILYESSHRIEKFMNDLLEILGHDRTICIAREITKRHETFLVGTSAQVHESFLEKSHKGEFVVLIAPKSFKL